MIDADAAPVADAAPDNNVSTGEIVQDLAAVTTVVAAYNEQQLGVSTYPLMCTNDFGNIVANEKVTLSDGSVLTSDAEGYIYVPSGLDVKE